MIRIYVGNRQVIHQQCGWGEGRTKEAAIEAAIKRAGPGAAYDPQSNMVWFDGGCYC